MSGFRRFKSKKYLQRIILSINLLMILLIIATSSTLYISAEKKVIEVQKEANSKILSQINYNITYMNEMITNTAMTSLLNDEFIPLMLDHDLTFIETYNKEIKLERVVSTSNFLESIGIYNPYHNKVYASGASLSNEDSVVYEEIIKMLKSDDNLQKLKLIPLSGNLFVFLMYESLTGYNKQESTLILTVKSEWLLESIKLINQLGHDAEVELYLLDTDSKVILSEDQTSERLHEIERVVSKQDNEQKETAGFFKYEKGNNSELISYMYVEKNDWTIVVAQPYKFMLGKMNAFRMTTIIVTGILLMIAVLISLFISLRLYRPVGNLLKQIGTGHNEHINETENRHNQDEISYVSSAYHNITQRLEQIEDEQTTTRDVVKNYYLKEIVISSHTYSTKEFKKSIEEHQLNISGDDEYIIIAFIIDHLKKFKENRTTRQINLYYFAISNIAEEIMNKRFKTEVTLTKTDQPVALVSIKNFSEHILLEIRDSIREIQETVFKLYNISISAAISECITNHAEISKQYTKTLEYMQYRIIHGDRSIITSSMVNHQLDLITYSIPSDLEKNLIESIHAEDLNKIEKNIDQLFDYLSKYNYDTMIHLIHHIVFIIHNTIRKMNENRLFTVTEDFRLIHEQIINYETIEEYKNVLKMYFANLFSQMDEIDKDKSIILVDTINDVIEANYKDMNLNLQGIASMLKMSSSYIGRIYKKSEGISVSHYINEVRLDHSLALLENEELTINEVLEKVGFGNQSYFFTLFKKRFGTTPKEYRLKHSTNNMHN